MERRKRNEKQKISFSCFFPGCNSLPRRSYAAVTDILYIEGVATVNATEAEKAFDADIKFVNAVANGAGTTNTASIVNDDKAGFTVNSLAGKGDSATFTFTIRNDGDLTAQVTPMIHENTNPAYFEVKSDWDGSSKELAGNGAEITYTVTVTMLQTPTTTVGGSVTIELTAVSG